MSVPEPAPTAAPMAPPNTAPLPPPVMAPMVAPSTPPPPAPTAAPVPVLVAHAAAPLIARARLAKSFTLGVMKASCLLVEVAGKRVVPRPATLHHLPRARLL